MSIDSLDHIDGAIDYLEVAKKMYKYANYDFEKVYLLEAKNHLELALSKVEKEIENKIKYEAIINRK